MCAIGILSWQLPTHENKQEHMQHRQASSLGCLSYRLPAHMHVLQGKEEAQALHWSVCLCVTSATCLNNTRNLRPQWGYQTLASSHTSMCAGSACNLCVVDTHNRPWRRSQRRRSSRASETEGAAPEDVLPEVSV